MFIQKGTSRSRSRRLINRQPRREKKIDNNNADDYENNN